MKITLKSLLIALIVLLVVAAVVCGRRKDNKDASRKRKSDQESSTEVPTEKGSRKRKGGRRHRNKKIVLKTSVKAKIVTERRYLKSDWCKSQPVRQHVRTNSGCHAVIINQFCYGQCNSFYIPKDIVIDEDANLVPDYFRSCAFCKPKSEEWISVRLRCKSSKKRKRPKFITKRMKRVKGCTCIAVPDLERLSEQIPSSEPQEPPMLEALSNHTTNAPAQDR